MDEETTITAFERVRNHYLTRRGVLTRGAALGLSVAMSSSLLAACGGDDDDDDEAETNNSAGQQDDQATEEDATSTEASTTETEDQESPAASEETEAEEGTEEAASSGEGEPQSGGTLRVAIPADVIGFDIRVRTDNPTLTVTELVFHPLVRLETDLSFQPDLATEWKGNEDATEFTFTLREGVKFHNGDDFTADDVVFTYESMLDPDFESSTAGEFRGIDEIVKVDDYTVTFKLSGPDAEFIDKVSGMGIVPSKYVQEVGDEEFNVKPVGSGPFKFVEWVPETRVVLERFEDYWNAPLPYLDEVIVEPISEDSVRLAAFEAAELDLWQRNVPPEHVERLQSDPRFVLQFEQFIYYHFISLNLERVEAFKNQKVRQALAYAIDRQAITDVLGYGTPGKGPIQPVSPYFNPDLPYYEYNPEKAQQLLEESGVDPAEVAFALQTFTYPDYQAVGELSYEMLKALGFDEELAVEDWTIVRAKCYQPEPSCDIFNSATGGLGPDAALYTLFHSEGSDNHMLYKNERVDELLEEGRRTLDTGKRKEIYDEVITIILEDSPMIFVNDQDIPALHWAYVKGFEINPWYSYMQLDRTWIDQAQKDEIAG